MDDAPKLLAEYSRTGSESAFRELVNRYVNFVHSTATRLVRGDSHLAEDVAQTVFIDLARAARTLPSDVLLGGWLHRHTCFIASKALRGELRRQNRERRAVELNALNNREDVDLSEIGPVLDDAINQLDRPERLAVLLRFFEQRDFRAVGAALNISEDAARMRVNRALEKLQQILRKAGVTCTTAALGNTLTLHAVTIAPAGLAATFSANALAVVAVVAGTAAGGGLAATLLRFLKPAGVKIVLVSGAATFATVLAVHSYLATPGHSGNSTPPPVATRTSQLPSSARFDALQARALAASSQPPPSGDATQGAPSSVATPAFPATLEAAAGRTALFGVTNSLLRELQAKYNGSVPQIEQELVNRGYVLILDGQKFVRVVPAAEKDRSWPAPAPRAPHPAVTNSATNTTAFSGMNLDLFLNIYAALLDRTLLRPSNLPSRQFTLATASPLTTDELAYAMGMTLELNGLSAEPDGDSFVRVEPPSTNTTPPAPPPSRNDHAPNSSAAAVNNVDFPGIDLGTYLSVYASITGRTILRPASLSSSPLMLKTTRPLTGAELAYALGTVLQMNGLVVIGDGDEFIQIVPASRSASVHTNAPLRATNDVVSDRPQLGNYPSAASLFRLYAGQVQMIANPLPDGTGSLLYPIDAHLPMTDPEFLYAIQATFELNGYKIETNNPGHIQLVQLTPRGQRRGGSAPPSAR